MAANANTYSIGGSIELAGNVATGTNTSYSSNVVVGTVSGMHDFLMRKLTAVQGRWMSPDPAGLAAVDFSNPQSFNRYAYVGNNPMSLVDPLGLFGGDYDNWQWLMTGSSFGNFGSFGLFGTEMGVQGDIFTIQVTVNAKAPLTPTPGIVIPPEAYLTPPTIPGHPGNNGSTGGGYAIDGTTRKQRQELHSRFSKRSTICGSNRPSSSDDI
jgi:RHS repeat-associated protein